MSEHFPVNPRARSMVRQQIETRGVLDGRILGVMSRIPRHLFVPSRVAASAYSDQPLPIGYRQTISQPYIVAYMTEELELSGGERVLEVGTGSGYQTAVLAELAGEVFTIERIPQLLVRASALLAQLGYSNIRFRSGDGFSGWPEEAPFDRILVAAAASCIPRPLQDQLADNGSLLIPVGEQALYQYMVKVRRCGSRLEVREGIGCRFVPLVH